MNPSLLPHRRAPRSRPLKSLSDEELAELIAQGHEEAFEALVARHRRVLLNHCSQLVGRTDAEEAVQETLLRAYLSLSRGHSVQRVSAWLRTIAHNTALNLLRARGARPAPAEQEPSEVVGDPFEQRERLRLVLEALGSLPERQREALVMRELEGRSYAEIESRLRTSNGAVRQLLNRGRARLRTRLGTLTGIEPALRWLIGNGSAGSNAVRLGALGGGCAVTAKLCATAVIPAVLAPAPPARAEAARPLQHVPGHVAARSAGTAAALVASGAMRVSYASPARRAAGFYVAYHPTATWAPRTGEASPTTTSHRWTGGTPGDGRGREGSGGRQPYGGGGTNRRHQDSRRGWTGGNAGASSPEATQSSYRASGHSSGADGYYTRPSTREASATTAQRASTSRTSSTQGWSGNGAPGGSATGNSRPDEGTLASSTPSGALSSSP